MARVAEASSEYGSAALKQSWNDKELDDPHLIDIPSTHLRNAVHM